MRSKMEDVIDYVKSLELPGSRLHRLCLDAEPELQAVREVFLRAGMSNVQVVNKLLDIGRIFGLTHRQGDEPSSVAGNVAVIDDRASVGVGEAPAPSFPSLAQPPTPAAVPVSSPAGGTLAEAIRKATVMSSMTWENSKQRGWWGRGVHDALEAASALAASQPPSPADVTHKAASNVQRLGEPGRDRHVADIESTPTNPPGEAIK